MRWAPFCPKNNKKIPVNLIFYSIFCGYPIIFLTVCFSLFFFFWRIARGWVKFQGVEGLGIGVRASNLALFL